MARRYKRIAESAQLTASMKLYLTQQEMAWLDTQAEAQETSRSAYVRSLVAQAMRRLLAQEKRDTLRKAWGQV
jgi:hypothetical protein